MSTSLPFSIPQENLTAFQLLFTIEVGIRELIIRELSSRYGVKWWKSRLPADVIEKYKNGISSEKSIKWIQLVPHHPIYYTDFPDLRKVIVRNDNWREVFFSIFKNDTAFSGIFAQIEPIRNKVAHHRKISEGDLEILKGAFASISSCMSPSGLQELVKSATEIPSISQDIHLLELEAHDAHKNYCDVKDVDIKHWQRIKKAWWFDSDYLDRDIQSIEDYFALLEKYKNLPRGRGMGYKIETWLRDNNIEMIYNDCINTFLALVEQLKEV